MKTDEISEILSKYFIDVDPTNFKINCRKLQCFV